MVRNDEKVARRINATPFVRYACVLLCYVVVVLRGGSPVLCVVTDQDTERVVGDFVMDAVAGARRIPGRLFTGGVPPKPPCSPRCSGTSVRSTRGVALSFFRAVAAAVTIFHVAAATSAWCRGTSQQNIAFQVFLQLPTSRRHVSRAVGAGVSVSFPPLVSYFLGCAAGHCCLTLVATVKARIISLSALCGLELPETDADRAVWAWILTDFSGFVKSFPVVLSTTIRYLESLYLRPNIVLEVAGV